MGEHQEVLELKDGEVFKVQLDKKVNKDHQENKDWEDPKDLLDQSDFKDHQDETDQKDQVEKLVHLVQMEPQDTLEPEDDQDHQDQPRTPSAANTSPPCCHLSERSSQSKNEQAAAATKDSQWDTSN